MRRMPVLIVLCVLLVGGQGQNLPSWYHRSRVRNSNTQNLPRGGGRPQTLPDPPRATREDGFSGLQPVPVGETTVVPDRRSVGNTRNSQPGSGFPQGAGNPNRQDGSGRRDATGPQSLQRGMNEPQERGNNMQRGQGFDRPTNKGNGPLNKPCDKKSCSPGEPSTPKEDDTHSRASEDTGRQPQGQQRPTQRDNNNGYGNSGGYRGQQQRLSDHHGNSGYGNSGYPSNERPHGFPNFQGINYKGNAGYGNNGRPSYHGNNGYGNSAGQQQQLPRNPDHHDNHATGKTNGNNPWQHQTTPEQKRLAKMYTLRILQKILDAIAQIRFVYE